MSNHELAALIASRINEMSRDSALNNTLFIESLLNQAQPHSPTWPHVLAFARRMEAKLEKNRHKGDREGWLKDDPWSLVERILDETVEVQQCFTQGSDGRIDFNDAE
jgi:hypothetical protein